MKGRKLLGKGSIILVLMLIFVFSFSVAESAFLNTFDEARAASELERETLVGDADDELKYTYQKVLMGYYKSVIQACDGDETYLERVGNFEEFCNLYYAQDEHLISEYVPYLVDNLMRKNEDGRAAGTIAYNVARSSTYSERAPMQRSASGDWWIGGALGANPDTISNKPNYDNFFYDIQPGDIIFEGVGIGEVVSHICIVEGKFDSNFGYFWRVVEAVPPAVTYSVYDVDRLVEKRGHILRVTSASDAAKANAIGFSKNQVGKPYTLLAGNPLNSLTWMCSTLAWAAYANQGIDLCPNYVISIFPQDIANSFLVMPVSFNGACSFLEVSVAKSYYVFPWSWDWDIKFTNKNWQSVSITYNSRLCFENDARDFTDLNDKVDTTITSNSSKTVRISNNGTAGYVAVMIKITVNNTEYKLVSYVNGLKYENNQGSTNPVRNYTII